MKQLICLFCFILAGFHILFAKENTKPIDRHAIGFIAAQGSQQLSPNLRMPLNYYYAVNYFQAQYGYTLKRNNNGALELLFQPQFNTMRYRYSDSFSTILRGTEFGLNGGFVYRRYFGKKHINSLYGLLSAGPHFVSGAPIHQAKGFIFSDNINIGIHIKIYPHTFVDIRTGFRHISNANLKQPNGGVNNFFNGIGVYYVL